MTVHTPAAAVTHHHTPSDCGAFRLDLTTGRWWWADATYRMHGFEPGEVIPTTAMVLAHKHPDDRERVRSLLERVANGGMPEHSVHRIIDARGGSREILLIVAGELGPGHAVASVAGCFVDLTAAVHATADSRASEAIRASDRSRAVIEQAKGIVSVVLDVDADEALPLLRTASNRSNVALRDLASWLVSSSRAARRRGMLRPDDVIGFLRAPTPPADGRDVDSTP